MLLVQLVLDVIEFATRLARRWRPNLSGRFAEHLSRPEQAVGRSPGCHWRKTAVDRTAICRVGFPTRWDWVVVADVDAADYAGSVVTLTIKNTARDASTGFDMEA